MATDNSASQGKTQFVEEYLANHLDANLHDVNKTWTASGKEGTVSESLVSKVRARLRQAVKNGAETPQPAAASANPRTASKPKPKRRALPKKSVKPEPTAKTGTSVPAVVHSAVSPADEKVFDELEQEMDEVIRKLRGLGNKPEVVRAMKWARRLLLLSQE